MCIGECHNLQDLNLSECTITVRDIYHSISVHTHTLSLSLSLSLKEEVMDVIARNCSGLLYLNLSYCYVTDTIIRTLAR